MSFEPLIRSLYDRHGELTAELVVNDARPADAPLHRYFEWDDETAAEAYRLEQARAMIRRVRYVAATPELAAPVREFMFVTDTTSSPQPRVVYRRVTDFTAGERDEVRERMRRAIASLVAQYREFDEFWELLRDAAA